MIKANSCTIRLLNKNYEIKCPDAEQESLQLAAKKLNEHLLDKKREFKSLDDFQVLLLAALQVSHELITRQAQQQIHRQQLTEFIGSLEHKMSQVARES